MKFLIIHFMTFIVIWPYQTRSYEIIGADFPLARRQRIIKYASASVNPISVVCATIADLWRQQTEFFTCVWNCVHEVGYEE